ncbi:MAG: fumarylacetoacetate hydrolase family protein [Geminicoccaceae bacterium]
MRDWLTVEQSLPADGCRGTLVGRAWLPGPQAGPALVAIRDDGVHDLSDSVAPTMSQLLELDDPAARVAAAKGRRIGDLAGLLANSLPDGRDPAKPWLLAPCDLQAIKAAGVTFVKSMLERVIEEQCKGDPARADQIRGRVAELIGGELRGLVPGSEAAMRLKQHLIEAGAWSQYLEVGIGPDAEIFTKAPPMSAVGTGADIGLHPRSTWNNPEPEVVLAVDSRGTIKGAALGNDVNLRDFEGRSALLLGKAKDNNGACAIGPFIRLLDRSFDLDALRAVEIRLTVAGTDGFRLEGRSSMKEISRDVTELVANTIGPYHQYPDGVMLYCGTMFAPVEDRHEKGRGFTHALGDEVRIAADALGGLANRVGHSDRIAPWTYGITALMRNLAARGLLAA